jgi:hypothetical protein
MIPFAVPMLAARFLRSRLRCRLWSAVAALAVGLTLALAWLAYAPEEHAHLHEGACEAEQGCVITLFAHGIETGGAESTAGIAAPASIIVASIVVTTTLLSFPEHRQPRGRGPPVRVSA